MRSLYYIILIALSLGACKKEILHPEEDPCTPIPCDTTKLFGILDTLWTSPLPDNKYGIISDAIFHHNDQIIFVGSSNVEGYVTAYHSITGENKWVWKDINVSHFSSSHLHSSNTLIVQNRRNIGVINMEDGSSLRIVSLDNESFASPDGQLLSDDYYATLRSTDDQKSRLIRTSFDDFDNWKTVYQLNRGSETGNSIPNIQSYNLWINPNSGDSILIFQHRMAFPDRVDVVAYNLRTREIEWKLENLNQDGNSNHQQIFIHDNKAYFGGSLTYYCFDMFTGEILWEYDEPNNKTTFMINKTSYAKSINGIIVKDGAGLYAFDPKSGSQIWYNPKAGDSSVGSGSPTYFDGIIYYTANAHLYAIRASDGEVLWSERSSAHPMGRTTFGGDIAIDPDRRVLYVTNENTLFAIKLYEPK